MPEPTSAPRPAPSLTEVRRALGRYRAMVQPKARSRRRAVTPPAARADAPSR